MSKLGLLKQCFRSLIIECHGNARDHGFWDHPREVGVMIALMHSELSEALEWSRKGMETKSNHIPEFTGVEEEIADVLIRVFDFCGGYDLDLSGALEAKMKYNASRPYKHGKKF